MRITHILLILALAIPSLSSFAVEIVDINKASAEEIAELDNIGPKKAKEIVEYREKNGAFKSLDDLQGVKGIGKATIEKNRDRMIVAQ